MKLTQSLLPLAACAFAFSGSAMGQTFVLEPSADGTLYEDTFGDYANGIGNSAYVGDNSSSEIRRAVLQFDTSIIPQSLVVSTVTLEFSVEQVSPFGPSSRPLNVHRVPTDWTEGLSDAGNPGGFGTDSEPGDATWIHRHFPTDFWNTPGGDFDANVSASTTITGATRYSITSPTLADEVQAWVDNPGVNNGWMLKMADETLNSAIRIATRESAIVSMRPTLTIVTRQISYFCQPAVPNSTGLSTNLIAGFGSLVGSDLHLEVYDGPPNQFGYFVVGTGANDPGIVLGMGRFCLATGRGNFFGRYNVSGGPLNSIGLFDATGRLDNVVGTSNSGTGYDVPATVPIPGNPTITAGDRYHFQLWHREDNGGSNFSNGATIQF